MGLGGIAVVAALYGYYYGAFAFALLGLLFDSLDGHLARKWNVASRFGAVADACADVVIYLFFPAVLIYELGYQSPAYLVGLAALLSLGVVRLIRFVRSGLVQENDGGLFYRGLPVFWTHPLVAFLLLVRLSGVYLNGTVLALIIFGGSLLMVGTFRFPKPSNIRYVAPPIVFAAVIFFFIEWYVR
ncbi:MAG: hypothetical protein A3H76_02620 [Candidatus Lloydbacteria bacterium RIFCSPLOWO2_02_FULL_54_12]|nr:MAG: hypothetical protein A3H76_02620 [Candidatus Lloydbacteria bacterium RIFCSPLOWO2_02_FULL_54_12]